MHPNALILRITGYVGSLILTLATYFIVLYPEFFQLGLKSAIFAIFIFAILQFIVQFIFFLDIWREKGPPWNLAVFFSTFFIIITIIFFSIWIMDNLNYNMMPSMKH